MKKIISIIISLIMALVPLQSFGYDMIVLDSDNLDNYVKNIVPTYIALRVDTKDTDKIYISQGYQVENNPDLNSRTYFVFRGETCIGRLAATIIDGEYFSSFVPFEYQEITKLYKNKSSFSLLSHQHNLFCISASEKYVINKQSDEKNDFIVDSKFSKTAIVLSEISQKNISDTKNIIANRAGDSLLLPVPHAHNITINGKGVCWIAAISAMAAYSHDDSTPELPRNIYNGLQSLYGGTPAGYANWEERAFDYCDINYVPTSTGFLRSDLFQILHSDKPVYAVIRDITLDSYSTHSVVICGYQAAAGTSYSYRLMDPNEYDYVSTNPISSSTSRTFTYVTSDYTYTSWIRSAHE